MKKKNDLMELVEMCDVAKSVDAKNVPGALETKKLLERLGFNRAADSITKRVEPILKQAQIAASGYIEITQDKIEEFLKRKVNEYEKHKPAAPAKTVSAINAMRNYLSSALGTTTDQYTSRYDQQMLAALAQSNTGTLQQYSDALNRQYVQTQNTWTPIPTSSWVETLSEKTSDYSTARSGTIGQFVWSEVAIDQYSGIPPLNVLQKFDEVKRKNEFDFYTVASVNAVHDPLLLGRIKDSTSRWFLAQWGDDVSLDDVI